jgi:hypothetical protein
MPTVPPPPTPSRPGGPRLEREVTVSPDGVIGGNATAHVGALEVHGEAHADLAANVGASGGARYARDGFDVVGHASWDGERVHLDGGASVSRGPARASVAVDGRGAITPTLDVSGAPAEGVRCALHLERGEGEARTQISGTLQLSERLMAPKLHLSADVRLADPEPVELGDDAAGALRRSTLARRPGARFERRRLDLQGSAGLGGALPLGPGRVETGFDRRGGLQVEQVRLADAAAPIPADADAILALHPGEEVTLRGHARLGARLLVGASPQGTLLASVGAQARVQADVSLSSLVSLRVLREEGSYARVRLDATHKRARSAGASLDVGLTLRVPPLELAAGPLVDAAAEALRLRTARVLAGLARASVHRGHETSADDVRLVEMRLDLSSPRAREALDAALDGDWTGLDTLALRGEAESLGSIFAQTRTETVPMVRAALGMSRRDEASRSRRVEVRRDAEGETREERREWRSAARWRHWLGGGARHLGHRVHEVAGGDGAVRGGVWLTWGNARDHGFSSTDQLRSALDVAALLGGRELAAALDEYRARLTGLKEQRVLGVGPRSELGKTEVAFDLELDEGALAGVRAPPLDELWTLARDAWRAAHPHDEVPTWAREGGRRSLEEHGPLRHTHAEYAPYHAMRVFLEELAALAGAGGRARLERLRPHLEDHRGDPTFVLVLAALAGPDHLRLGLRIDAQGEADTFDFAYEHVGSRFQSS